MTEDNSQAVMNRRSILQTVGATAVLATGTTGISTAQEMSEKSKESQRKYKDQKVRKQVFRKHAGTLISELAQRNLIKSPSLSELKIGTFHDGKTRMTAQESKGGVAATSYQTETGEYTPLVMVAKNTATHTIRIYVKPELQESYALVRERESGDEFAIDTSKEDVKLEPTATCNDFYLCGDQCAPNSCPLGGGVLYQTEYYSCYEEVPDRCSCYIEGTSCGAEDCYNTC